MSAIHQAELWILQQRKRRAERALQYPDLVGPDERPVLEADLREAIMGIREIRDAEGAISVPLCDYVHPPGGDWTPLEDAAIAVTGLACAGFIREERLETYWSERIVRLCDLPVVAIADSGHIDRVTGRLKVVVVADPIADGEHRARVMTRAAGDSPNRFEERGMVFIPGPVAGGSRATRA